LQLAVTRLPLFYSEIGKINNAMIKVQGPHFVDELGRTLLLRGVNLGGTSKIPLTPNGATHLPANFFDHPNISFIGRPFPLSEADEHFRRLRGWGLSFVRFLVTWEAIEHAGPGIYDENYLDYVRAIVQKAGDNGISLFIDPHQDVWSRFSGGDGAPGWTLEAVGFEPTCFAESGAAIVHQTHGDPFPKMVWSNNASKLAAATMFSLFFGGNDFAPLTRIEGEPAQEYLQRHYIEAIRQVALRLNDLPNVVGYDTLNEPSPGFIGLADLRSPQLSTGDSPTPYQAILLGAGFPQQIDRIKIGALGLIKEKKRLVNPGRVRAWGPDKPCIWQQNGVWDVDSSGTPHLLRPAHFALVGNRRVNFAQDYLRPFANRFANAIRSADRRAVIFVEPAAADQPPHWTQHDAPNVVYAPHWYDGYTLAKKEFSRFLAVDSFRLAILFSAPVIRRSFTSQMAILKNGGDQAMGGVPTLVGEFGIPFDLNQGLAYRSGDFSSQEWALDRTFQALEANLLNGTLWVYTSDNTNARGDQWNGEDFSIFSRDQQKDPGDLNSGGRALLAAVRPYPRATAGKPLHMRFNFKLHLFEYTFRHDPQVDAPTELFIPNLHYPHGYRVEVSDGACEMDATNQILRYHHTRTRAEHTIRVHP
jgi:hypothetical protein